MSLDSTNTRGAAFNSNVVVMKFGGTSVGSVERIQNVAKRVAKHVKTTGQKVVVVVSAMSGETDRLIDLGKKIGLSNPVFREQDQLIASGEQVTSALTAMALNKEGVKSLSLLAPQIPIKTKNYYGQNIIKDINADKLWSLLNDNYVPVVAGFQGIDDTGSYTTLGRGGSDNTAVALAAALNSCPCYIFTDIDGVYSALPSICKKAVKKSKLSYEEMLELASGGAKVLQARSVNLAYKHKVPLFVASSFAEIEGTEIVEEYEGMEDSVVSGITCRTDESKVTLRNIPDQPGIAAKIFKVLGDSGIVVDMIVQSQGAGNTTNISLTVPSESINLAFDKLSALIKSDMKDATIDIDKDIAKLSVVGEGMRNHAGVAYKIFEVLGKENINIEMITTSEIKVSLAIKQKYAELAVRSLHEYFIENQGLEK